MLQNLRFLRWFTQNTDSHRTDDPVTDHPFAVSDSQSLSTSSSVHEDSVVSKTSQKSQRDDDNFSEKPIELENRIPVDSDEYENWKKKKASYKKFIKRFKLGMMICLILLNLSLWIIGIKYSEKKDGFSYSDLTPLIAFASLIVAIFVAFFTAWWNYKSKYTDLGDTFILQDPEADPCNSCDSCNSTKKLKSDI